MRIQVERGQIYTINLGFDNKIGSEQCGDKICVIVQNNTGNKFSPTTIVCVITSKVDKADIPVHVAIHDSVGMYKPSIVLGEQCFTIDKKRLGKLIGEMEMDELNEALAISLGLKEVVR